MERRMGVVLSAHNQQEDGRKGGWESVLSAHGSTGGWKEGRMGVGSLPAHGSTGGREDRRLSQGAGVGSPGVI
jgi:hypothetical protein